ncbi:endonuclease V [Marinithermus hydrothermalis]|uniref:Endonuclease V n=1 Tax=Marinithermus hydrothermalis (strain DSM 14884 / JCM 11576 / T1) TaxID=869210 RepID=F2NKY8_MARHT|nr:endonuclease V [Marinithermus hydrothermalis]AEB11177.1 Endonuclease V [Marinithermus hydrothermalis DSM 14884]
MPTFPPFPKPSSLEAARRLQEALAARVVLEGDPRGVRFVGALDASVRRGEDLVAAAVLWDLEAGDVLEVGLARVPAGAVFPYVPGFLSFREAPVYLEALACLSRGPDLLLVDGQGIAHPRGLGIAAHLGVHLDLPSVGVAKSRLCGAPQGALALEKGSAVPLVDGARQIGWVYRSRTGVKPLYVSPGHRVGMREALEFVRGLPGRTRLPEPLRTAHLWAGRARREGVVGRVVLG